MTTIARLNDRLGNTTLHIALRLLFAGLAATLSACSYQGFIPKEKPADLEAPELEIEDITLGSLRKGALDCPAGDCRIRYRIVVAGPGSLAVVVNGPPEDPSGTGPDIIRIALEDAIHNVLDMKYDYQGRGADEPLRVTSPVKKGVYYVLIQGLGGVVAYDVHADFTPGEASAATMASTIPTAESYFSEASDYGDEAADSGRTFAGSGHRTGDVSDGADFAFDPTVDLRSYKTYAFAQDPLAELQQGNAASNSNPFVERQVQREVRYQLAESGFGQVDPQEADFLVSVHVGSRSTTWYSISSRTYDRPYDDYFQQWQTMGMYVRRHSYVDGTLVIDLIDRRTGKLIWHGWTTEPLPIGQTPEEIIKQAVKNVVAQYAG